MSENNEQFHIQSIRKSQFPTKSGEIKPLNVFPVDFPYLPHLPTRMSCMQVC